MASIEELKQVRLDKRNMLVQAGMDPHPADVQVSHTIENIFKDFQEEVPVCIAGRVLAIRGAGAISFVVIHDGTGTAQVVLKKDTMEVSLLDLFLKTVDIGDFVWFEGSTFVTQRGAQSVLATSWRMASKSLLPLPDKYAGIQDKDEIYRKRYLETISSEEAFERFKTRSRIIKAIRSFLDARDFMEIETPILQNQAGGAMAQTFHTHHLDLDIPMVLRISLELEHKIVMAGGYRRIYEIGKNFRNEGSDPTHIQEFTMLEWYAAYETLEQNMQWTQELLTYLASEVVGKTSIRVHDKEGNEHAISFDGEWRRVRFDALLLENASLDIHTASDDDIRAKAQAYGLSQEESTTMGIANILDYIYKKSSRNTLMMPTFVTHYPGNLKPLAQQNEDGTAQVAQLIIAGAEITNQYAELVDPLVQRVLLEKQKQAKDGGDTEAMDIDERFITAMEHGMPPMTGFGMGIDRLVALLTEQDNLRDVIFFPIMKEK